MEGLQGLEVLRLPVREEPVELFDLLLASVRGDAIQAKVGEMAQRLCRPRAVPRPLRSTNEGEMVIPGTNLQSGTYSDAEPPYDGCLPSRFAACHSPSTATRPLEGPIPQHESSCGTRFQQQDGYSGSPVRAIPDRGNWLPKGVLATLLTSGTFATTVGVIAIVPASHSVYRARRIT